LLSTVRAALRGLFASSTPPKVLVIDDWLPDPRIGAGAPRALAMLRALIKAGVSVTLLPTMKEPDDAEAVVRLVPGLMVVAPGGTFAAIGPFLAGHGGAFDLIMVSRPHNMAAFRQAVAGMTPAPDFSRVVYDAEAIFAVRESLRRDVLGAPNSAEQTAREIAEETALAAGTRMIVAVNAATAALFRAAGHQDVRVLGHAAVTDATRTPFLKRDGFLFVGPTYADGTPNTDAVIWFADRVLPQIRARLARHVPFVLAGVQGAQEVAARAGTHLTSLGAIPDLTEAYSAARVFVAPTRFSAGIPLKVYEAAARGVPCVLTPLLAEQLGWHHEQEILVAATPEEFGEQCVRLHEDRALWERLRARALRRVARDCDPRLFDRFAASMLRHAR